VDVGHGKAVCGRVAHDLRFARRIPADAQHTAVAQVGDARGPALLQGTSFPGFMIPFGSKSSLMPR
jgi:hypothetical protein